VFFEIPLDQVFCGVFTDARSGKRTPTGAVRRGASAQPTPLTRRERSRSTDSVHGHLGPGHGRLSSRAGNDESANVTGDRGGRRVRPDPRAPSGGRGRRRPAGAFDATGQPGVENEPARRSGSQQLSGWSGQRSRGEEPKELGPPQLDSARSVPIGTRTEGSGNRVSVKRCLGIEAGQPVSSPKRGIARRAARRDGRCEQVESKANARRSTSGGPVHESPRRVRRRKPATRRGAFVFPLPTSRKIPGPGR
jgi:hypothetical protein